MNKTQFREHIRFLANDTSGSNFVQHELLSGRPENIYDGVNTVFNLYNRRICGFTLFNSRNVEISGTEYTLASGSGRLVYNTAPSAPGDYADYFFQKLTDAEMDLAITVAAGAGGFNENDVQGTNLDYSAMFALSYCYTAMASKAAEYYTISAAGKQVSKSELFNHYKALAVDAMAQAKALRTDQFTDRGYRDQAGDAVGTCDWVQPYIHDGGS